MMTILFFIFMVFALWATYGMVWFGLPYFWGQKRAPASARNVYSLMVVLCVFTISFLVSVFVSDPAIGNRILHAFGGGFTAFVVYALAARDSQVVHTRFQFFVLGFLLVTTLGVCNELAEFAGEYITTLSFVPDVYDTWYDLLSNTVGIVIAMFLYARNHKPSILIQ